MIATIDAQSTGNVFLSDVFFFCGVNVGVSLANSIRQSGSARNQLPSVQSCSRVNPSASIPPSRWTTHARVLKAFMAPHVRARRGVRD